MSQTELENRLLQARLDYFNAADAEEQTDFVNSDPFFVSHTPQGASSLS